MAYDEGLACRLGVIYTAMPGVVEKKMFGAAAFMVNGHMSCGVGYDTLMVRVGSKLYARPMAFTGKAMKGFVYVAPKGFESDEELMSWVQLSMDFAMAPAPK